MSLESSVFLTSLPRVALLPAFEDNVLTCRFETVALQTKRPNTATPSPPMLGPKLSWFLDTFGRYP